MYLPDVNRMLQPGAEYQDDDWSYVLERHIVGELELPTGKLVAGEPMSFATEGDPFLAEVPVGAYSAVAWVAVLRHKHDQGMNQSRVAALQLVVHDSPAQRWEPALMEGQDVSALEDEDDYFGYTVDGGRGGFADLSAVHAVDQWDFEDFVASLEGEGNPAETPIGAVISAIDQETGASVVGVNAGWGDGDYPTFVGYTETGEIASFVTDFLVLPDSK